MSEVAGPRSLRELLDAVLALGSDLDFPSMLRRLVESAVSLVEGLAAAAGVAIENARLHARVQELAVVEDRERIARDLHDTVIQRLFATGLSLQRTSRLVRSDAEAAASRIEAAVDDLDLTVKRIRSAIFKLESGWTTTGVGLRDRVLSLGRQGAGALGFDPRCFFDGPVDTGVPDDIAHDLMATLREALANVARHAGATQVDIDVAATDQVVLRVVDDGVGPPAREAPRGHGLKNKEARAANRGGSFALRAGAPRGSVMEWKVPLT